MNNTETPTTTTKTCTCSATGFPSRTPHVPGSTGCIDRQLYRPGPSGSRNVGPMTLNEAAAIPAKHTWKAWYIVPDSELGAALSTARKMAREDHPDTPLERMMTPHVSEKRNGWRVMVVGKPL